MQQQTFAPQGSEEWKRQRLGKVTASKLAAVMTNGRGKDAGMGQTAFTYLYDLLAERITGLPQDELKMKALDWGNEHEDAAAAVYSLRNETKVVKTGFLVHPEHPNLGGSPDRLIHGDSEGPGGLEIKCPFVSRIHLQYFESKEIPKAYKMQIQGLMWITGRSWWDFVSYDPRMPGELQLRVIRERADLDLHDDFEQRVGRFFAAMRTIEKKIRSNASE